MSVECNIFGASLY